MYTLKLVTRMATPFAALLIILESSNYFDD